MRTTRTHEPSAAFRIRADGSLGDAKMAKKYRVEVHETLRYEWTIEASTADEAREKAMRQVWQSGIVRRTVKNVRVAR